MSADVESSLRASQGGTTLTTDTEQTSGHERAEIPATKDAYRGRAGTATVTGLQPSGAAILYELSLPDETVGELLFLDPQFSNAPLYRFLHLYGDDADPESVVDESIPVTYTDSEGWCVPISENMGLSKYQESGDSDGILTIDEQTGRLTATRVSRVGCGFISFLTGVIAGVHHFGPSDGGGSVLLALGVTVVVGSLLAYLLVAIAEICQPRMKAVTSESHS